MVVLSLPLSFSNSFWTPEYRKGLQVLYSKLEEGAAENEEIVAFIRARAQAENHLAISLAKPAPIGRKGTGFATSDGASLLTAFRGLQAESVSQGEKHANIAKELSELVADPFGIWANGYKERLARSKLNVIEGALIPYEMAQVDVLKLKNTYLTKTRKADEADDDAKFAPNSDFATNDKFTSSPRLAPHDPRGPHGHAAPQRSVSVSERIAARLKEIQKKSVNALAGATETGTDETVFEAGSEGTKSPPHPVDVPKVDKGKGKAIEVDTSDDEKTIIMGSPPAMSSPLPPPSVSLDSPAKATDPAQAAGIPTPPAPYAPAPIVLANVSFPPAALSALLKQAQQSLPLRAYSLPLIGSYDDCFSGDEFVAWLNATVPQFEGNLDRAEDAAREMTERENLLRRIGELGNAFEHSDEAMYQFRPKAFELGERKASDSSVTGLAAGVGKPLNKNLAPLADTFLKRTNNLANVVVKALNNPNASEPAYIKARHAADEADLAYRVAIRRLDRQRLDLEERIEDTLKTLQRWETERLRAVKTVLLQYHGTLSNLPKELEPINERSKTLVASYQPESDLKALIEQYRTGPFHPTPQVYESVAHDESDVLFGIDLRRWAEGGWDVASAGEQQKKELYPNVLNALLKGVTTSYDRLPNDAEKRKAWIYEVPLSAVHHLRESLNGVDPEHLIPADLFAKYDAPVIAGAIKLWILELNPPLAMWEGWDDFRNIYPTVGAKALPPPEGQTSEEQHIQELSTVLQKLPKTHLYVLDALVSHFKNLIETTHVDEDNEVYLTKLALSVGRTIVRPKTETEMTLHDRHPTLLFIDLVKNYTAILPPTIEKKKRESVRKVPIRKRTAPVDMRMLRGRISVGAPTREIYAAQKAAQKADAERANPPPVPPLPPVATPVTVPAAPPAAPVAVPVAPPAQTQAAPALAKPIAPPPPPPLVAPQPVKPVIPPPPPPTIPPPPPVISNQPPRPTFKEPPPENDDAPPRPMFKEPPPEDDDYTPPSRPRFVDPAVSPPSTPPPQIPAAVTPPTPNKPSPVPTKRNSLITRASSPSPSNLRPTTSRSPSPANSDAALSPSQSNLARSGSGQSGYVRGPRLSRGPRAPGGGSVSSMVSSMNRQSVGGPPTSGSYKRVSSGSSPARPQSMVGRTQALSRRTMASDAEDEVVQ